MLSNMRYIISIYDVIFVQNIILLSNYDITIFKQSIFVQTICNLIHFSFSNITLKLDRGIPFALPKTFKEDPFNLAREIYDSLRLYNKDVALMLSTYPADCTLAKYCQISYSFCHPEPRLSSERNV